MNLARRKAHGNDGIPGEAYEETRQCGNKTHKEDNEPREKWATNTQKMD